MQNPLWNKQVARKFINITIENNLSHRSGSKITLCNVAMKVYLLLSHIYIWTFPFIFAMTWCPSATSIYLSISYNEPGMKPGICCVIWHVALEYKIQLVNCELSLKYLLGISSLPVICTIYEYILWLLKLSPSSNFVCDSRLPVSLEQTWFHCFLLSPDGFGNLAIRWSTYPHQKHLRG